MNTKEKKSLEAVATKIFTKSGDMFFKRFKSMHDALMDFDPRGEESEEGLLQKAIDVLRFWAGDLKKPSSPARRGAPGSGRRQSLYRLVKNEHLKKPLVVNAAHALALDLAWDYVLTKCGNRCDGAFDSNYWDEDAKAERGEMWGIRHDSMSVNSGVSDLADAVFKSSANGDASVFIEALLEKGMEELEA